jgi:hypothetical protein
MDKKKKSKEDNNDCVVRCFFDESRTFEELLIHLIKTHK